MYKKLVVFLFLSFSVTLSSFAQTGWQWGVGSTHPNTPYYGFDEQAAVLDRNGSIFVAGYGWGDSSSFGPLAMYNNMGYEPLVIVKIDSVGLYQWVTAVRHSNCNTGGMVTDRAGNLYVLVSSDSGRATIDTFSLLNPLAPSQPAVFLMKLSPAGHALWVKTIGQVYFNTSNCVAIDGADNVYVTSEYPVGSLTLGSVVLSNWGIGDNVFVAKYDTSGNVIWAKGFGGSSIEFSAAITSSAKGDVYFTGSSYSDSMSIGTTKLYDTMNGGHPITFLAKLDSSGNPLWAISNKNRLNIYNMKTDINRNIYIAGSCDTNVIYGTDTLPYVGNGDAFIAKFNPDGVFKWAKSVGDSGADAVYGMDIDACGKIWLCGQFGHNTTEYIMNFGGHVLTAPIIEEPTFIVNYDTSGNYDTCFYIPGGGDDFNNILIDNKSSFYVAGDYSTVSVGLKFGPDTLLQNVGSEALFAAKYKYGTVICTRTEVGTITSKNEDILLYPNPANNYFTISTTPLITQNNKIELFDITGKLVSTYIYTINAEFNIRNLLSGLYICKMTTDDGNCIIKKLLIGK